jgi:formyl-CoA transferase
VRRLDDVPGVPRPVDVFTAGYQLSGGAPEVQRPPPALGQHNDEVLRELGYAPAEIDTLRAEGVI